MLLCMPAEHALSVGIGGASKAWHAYHQPMKPLDCADRAVAIDDMPQVTR
jgi:hypothetical protein